jgi:hypothetical protein
MAEILRTWGCLNCNHRFDAWEPNPECPSCGCVRVSWVPGGGHIAGVSRSADAEFRSLADTFGLSDLASGGNGAKVLAKQPAVSPQSGPSHSFAPGFACVPDPSRPVCVPSTAGVDARGKIVIGQALPPSKVFPNPRGHTVVEASHRPKP